MKKLLFALCALSATLLWAQDLPFLNASGFVDGAYFYDGNANPDSGEFNAFSLDQVEVDLQKQLGEKGFIRADIEYVNGADPMNAIDYIEQGFMQYNFPVNDKTLEVMFGKFNAPIGFELLDPRQTCINIRIQRSLYLRLAHESDGTQGLHELLREDRRAGVHRQRLGQQFREQRRSDVRRKTWAETR
jgi:hypothetical protein